MNFKLFACVAMVVGVAYLAVFKIIDNMRALSQGRPAPPPEPTFTTTTFRYRNDQGQDVKVVQEFKISTQFADPELLKTLPPPPFSTAAPQP
jgi:hypothetical protein